MSRESSILLRRRAAASFTAIFVVTFLLLIVGIYAGLGLEEFIPALCMKRSSTAAPNSTLSLTHRKLLTHVAKDGQGKGHENEKGVQPNRIWGDKCSKSDIVISQGPTEPLPNGIPTYTVEIMNVCASGCDISAIHLSCGWFSSARLVNPRVFKRLHFNDCLVNDGNPLGNGRTLSFQYANTFPYSLSVSFVSC